MTSKIRTSHFFPKFETLRAHAKTAAKKITSNSIAKKILPKFFQKIGQGKELKAAKLDNLPLEAPADHLAFFDRNTGQVVLFKRPDSPIPASNSERAPFLSTMDHTLLDEEGRTYLHRAVLMGDEGLVKKYMQEGASPFLGDYRSLFKSANMQMIRVLTGTDQIKAFDACHNIHDFFELLFPSETEVFPPNWKELSKLAPFSTSLKAFEEEMMNLKQKLRTEEEIVKDVEKAMGDLNEPLSVEIVCRHLIKAHPGFAIAFQTANQLQPISLEKGPHEGVADYCPETHTIRVAQKNLVQTIRALIFETMNALQRISFITIDLFGEEGKLDRDGYTYCTEIAEDNSLFWALKMRGNELSDPLTRWKKANHPVKNGISHADAIRYHWDKSSGWAYLRRHPDVVAERLAKLASLDKNASDLDDGKETAKTLSGNHEESGS